MALTKISLAHGTSGECHFQQKDGGDGKGGQRADDGDDKGGPQGSDNGGDDGDNDDEDNDNYSEDARKQKQKRPPTPFRPHVRRTCFTAEADYLCGYEDGRSRPSHPGNADPSQRVATWS